MSDKVESANLILKLYDLRREDVMRQARQWYFAEFHPGSFEEVSAAGMGEKSPYFRMVTTYWDMACSFVNHGAIDAEMFNDANGEHMFVYAKLEPFLPALREEMGNPQFLAHLEKVVKEIPNYEARLTAVRERMQKIIDLYLQRAAAAAAAAGN